MDLLLKPVTHRVKIFRGLRVFRKPGQFSFIQKFFELCVFYFCQFLLSCKDIHGQLFKIGQVQLVHLIQKSGILHELHLMLLKHFYDLIDICLGFSIFRFHGLDLIRRFLKETEDPTFFFLFIESF